MEINFEKGNENGRISMVMQTKRMVVPQKCHLKGRAHQLSFHGTTRNQNTLKKKCLTK
jgi:hypothetical protein